MIKLYRARSLLYRRKFLQENIRWKALDEIYKMYMLFHRSWFSTDSKNSNRTLIWIVRMVRSVAYRTSQLRLKMAGFVSKHLS